MSHRRMLVPLCSLMVWMFLVASCKPEENGPTPPASSQSQPESHSGAGVQVPRAEFIRFEFAVYYLPEPGQDPVKAVEEIVSRAFPAVSMVAALAEKPSGVCLRAKLEDHVAERYAPPGLTSLSYFGHGLTRQQAMALQESRQALILDFAFAREQVWTGLRAANAIVNRVARQTDGLVWDNETREVYTPEAWESKRITSWTEELPAVSDHIVIHVYRKDEYVRAITLGMAKFGLPDVVVDEFPWSLNRNMGHLLNLFCQVMAEGATTDHHGDFDLDLRAIKNAKTREPQIASLKSNAKAIARLRLKTGKWEEGDPQNPLIEIGFDRNDGPDLHARQDSLLGELFGWEDASVLVKNTEELLAASRRAREKLPALREDFGKGLEPGEFIEVKAPFKRPDGGTEWMWVEVMAWKGPVIKGLLKNEPFSIPSLHGGQEVTVKQDDVFDYIRLRADGTQEGNETSKVIAKQSKGP